jgi:hypothetical protein
MTSCVTVQNESYTPEKINLSDTLLNEKIEYYRHLYPEIAFLILQGGDDLLLDMMALDVVLGYQPRSMDYEHPPELREDLMFVSVERIWIMLQSYAPSASLFKADTPLGWQEHVCVLTINPSEVAADSTRATRHLLDLPQEVIHKIPQNLQLPPDDYLAFIIDHEVYHCLKSMYVGPQLMSHKELWGGYNHFLDEQGADAYALGMHIKTRGTVSLFAKNIQRIRGMALYNADPDHLTCKALEQVLKIPTENITKMSANDVFDMANSIRDRLNTGYDEYIQHLASTVQAMKEIGVGDLVSEELRNKIKDIQADPAQVKELVANTRHCLNELSGNELEP